MNNTVNITISEDLETISVELKRDGNLEKLTGTIARNNDDYCVTLSSQGGDKPKNHKIFLRRFTPNVRENIEKGVADYFIQIDKEPHKIRRAKRIAIAIILLIAIKAAKNVYNSYNENNKSQSSGAVTLEYK